MTNPVALVVDDEPDIRELLEITLGRMNIETRSARNLEEALARLSSETFDLCLTDMQLPDGNGIDLVRTIQKKYPLLPVAVITAFGSMETAITALKEGAFDFVSKPVELQRLRDLVNTALKLSASQNDSPSTLPSLIGESPAIRKLETQIRKLARSQAPVYISGESGSGKELVARLIHQLGPRADKPFVPVNCGAIPSELMESEFFGHKKGSFTGAVDDKPGLFQAANGGTLFLDEVADLPLHMQVKLLRAIQEKSVRSIGASSETPIDVRILSATHKNLAREVEEERFRQDLFYRINVIEAHVPPLRERQEDIPLLTDNILERLSRNWGIPQPALTPAAREALQRYRFPGNVRELENILERALTLSDDDTIDEAHLQLPEFTSTTDTPSQKPSATSEVTEPLPLTEGQSLEDYLETIEKQQILKALEATRWNRTAAAKKLGMSFRSLRYRLKKLGLDEINDSAGSSTENP